MTHKVQKLNTRYRISIMKVPKVKSQIEMLANFLESEGFVREAYNVDTFLNALDKNDNVDIVFGGVAQALVNVLENVKKVYEADQAGYNVVNTKFRNIFRKIKPLMDAIRKSSTENESRIDFLRDITR